MQPRHPSDTTTGSPAGAAVRPAPDPDEVYVLRLCLDLMLDAMMLALGAAACDPARQPAFPPGTRSGAVGVGGPGGVRWGDPPGAFPPVPAPGSSPLSGPIPTGSITTGSIPTGPTPTGPTPTGSGSGRRSPTSTGRTPTGSGPVESRPGEPVSGEPRPTGSAPGSTAAGSVPAAPEPDGVRWQRWLREDVEQARSLAAELLHRGGGLPAWLAAARTAGSSAAVVARLESFHAQTQTLLTELELTLVTDPGAADRIGAPQVHAAARQVRRRLGELDLLRREPQATDPAVTGPRGLPGEFLG